MSTVYQFPASQFACQTELISEIVLLRNVLGIGLCLLHKSLFAVLERQTGFFIWQKYSTKPMKWGIMWKKNWENGRRKHFAPTLRTYSIDYRGMRNRVLSPVNLHWKRTMQLPRWFLKGRCTYICSNRAENSDSAMSDLCDVSTKILSKMMRVWVWTQRIRKELLDRTSHLSP